MLEDIPPVDKIVLEVIEVASIALAVIFKTSYIPSKFTVGFPLDGLGAYVNLDWDKST